MPTFQNNKIREVFVMIFLIILACFILIFFIVDVIVNLVYVRQSVVLKKVVNDLSLKYFTIERDNSRIIDSLLKGDNVNER